MDLGWECLAVMHPLSISSNKSDSEKRAENCQAFIPIDKDAP